MLWARRIGFGREGMCLGSIGCVGSGRDDVGGWKGCVGTGGVAVEICRGRV